MVSELIAKAGKPFSEGQFLKDCMLHIADILCPKLVQRYLYRLNAVEEWINELSRDIWDQLGEQA